MAENSKQAENILTGIVEDITAKKGKKGTYLKLKLSTGTVNVSDTTLEKFKHSNGDTLEIEYRESTFQGDSGPITMKWANKITEAKAVEQGTLPLDHAVKNVVEQKPKKTADEIINQGKGMLKLCKESTEEVYNLKAEEHPEIVASINSLFIYVQKELYHQS